MGFGDRNLGAGGVWEFLASGSGLKWYCHRYLGPYVKPLRGEEKEEVYWVSISSPLCLTMAPPNSVSVNIGR